MKLSRQLPLNALRVFEATARHLSFTKAGDELGMTQTAVSYQIKLLEDFIGVALFVRKPRQVILTESGQKLAPKVSEAFGSLRNAVADAKQIKSDMLFIHTTPTLSMRVIRGGNNGFIRPVSATRLCRTAPVAALARRHSRLPPLSQVRASQFLHRSFTPMRSRLVALCSPLILSAMTEHIIG